MIVRREFYYLILGFLSSLSMMGATLFFVGRPHVQQDVEPVAPQPQTPLPVHKKLRESALTLKPALVAAPQKPKPEKTIKDSGNIVKVIETKESVSQSVAPAQKSCRFDPLDPNGEIPQTVQELEQYISEMSQAIEDLLEGNDALRDMLKDISEKQIAEGKEKSLRDTVIDKALGYPVNMADVNMQRMLKQFEGQSRLRNRAALAAEQARIKNEFTQAYQESEVAEAQAGFAQRSLARASAIAARVP